MARDENIRVSPAVVAQDKAAFNALQKISGYAPSNREHAVESLLAAIDEMHAAQIAEDQTVATAATARDKAAEAEWKVHNLTLGAKDQGWTGNDWVVLSAPPPPPGTATVKDGGGPSWPASPSSPRVP